MNESPPWWRDPLAMIREAEALERQGRSGEARRLWAAAAFYFDRAVRAHPQETRADSQSRRPRLNAAMVGAAAILAGLAALLVLNLDVESGAEPLLAVERAAEPESDKNSPNRGQPPPPDEPEKPVPGEDREPSSTAEGSASSGTETDEAGGQVTGEDGAESPHETPVDVSIAGFNRARRIRERRLPDTADITALPPATGMEIDFDVRPSCRLGRRNTLPGAVRGELYSSMMASMLFLQAQGSCTRMKQLIEEIAWRRSEASHLALAFSVLGLCFYERGNLNAALTFFQEARCYDDDYVAPVAKLGQILMLAREPAKVRSAMAELKRKGERLAKGKYNVGASDAFDAYGWLAGELGDLREAESGLARATELDPLDDETAANFAEIAMINGRFDRAFEVSQDVLVRARSPGLIPVMRGLRLCSVLFGRQSLREARVEMNEILAWHRENESSEGNWTWKLTLSWLDQKRREGLDRRFDVMIPLIEILGRPKPERLAALERLKLLLQ
jgi:tetratricopeptide (TPR) repeat protein